MSKIHLFLVAGKSEPRFATRFLGFPRFNPANLFNLMKILVLTITLTGLSMSASANDTIRFTWTASSTSNFYLTATNGEPFTIDWGDGSIVEPKTGTGNDVSYSHAGTGTLTVTIYANTTACRFTYLACTYNSLSALDVSKSTSLTELRCYNNSLSVLDLSQNTALTEIRCFNNSLSVLNLSQNTALTSLQCDNNSLSDLNVSQSTALKTLYCNGNSLSVLDVSQNTALTRLECYNNSLSTLDLSKNTALTTLLCYNNSLSTLDLSKNTALTNIYCNDNSLSVLDLSQNTKLTISWCYNNTLPLSDLYLISERLKNNGGNVSDRRLGNQNLPTLSVLKETVLFSDQSKCGTEYTKYTVTQNGFPANTSYYTVTDGKITFHTVGTYVVVMTNDAIVSNASYPAQVGITLTVKDSSDVGIVRANNYSPLRVYPNPTTGQLRISLPNPSEGGAYEAGNVAIYDVLGRLYIPLTPFKGGIAPSPVAPNSPFEGGRGMSEIIIDVSHLAKGMYFLKVDNKVVKFVKE